MTRNDICHQCGKKVEWKPDVVYVEQHDRLYLGYTCEECGLSVPEFAFNRYLRTGVVVIPRKGAVPFGGVAKLAT